MQEKLKTLINSLWSHPGHLFWVACAYLPFLGHISIPLTGDQKLYMSTALEMKETGNWLQPILFAEPSYYKPPFQYWMTLISWKIFGFNLWAALLPSVFFVLLTAWCLGEIAYLLHERRLFVNAGLWFAAGLGTATFGTAAQMEIYVSFFYTVAWYCGLKFLARPIGFRNFNWLFAAFCLAGVSALIKSPLYSVLWSIGFLSYLILAGEWELFRERRLHYAILCGIFIGSLWYAIILSIDPGRFWSQYIQRESLEKLSGNQGSVFSLWGSLLYYCYPFTLMIFAAIRAVLKKGRRISNLILFLICWTWPPFLFFSFFPYRNKPYAYILLPLFTILVDWAYFRVGRTKFFRTSVGISGVVILLFSVLLALVVYRGELAPQVIPLAFVLSGIWIFYCAFKDWMRGMVLGCLFTVLLFRLTTISMGEWDLSGLKKEVKLKPRAPVALLDEEHNIWHDVGLLSAALKKPIARLTQLDQVTDFLQSGGILALDDEQTKNHLRTIEAKLLGRGDSRVLEEKPWPRWQRKNKFPLKEFLIGGKSGISDFEELTKRQFKILWLKN